ncbi:hypothetical protein SE17_05960 [Kouleothrix aurantiaca]|uniref:Uncharacterized protein n=1 Tax=Kouleothrix aurantiaca TaxID=186479 RepID=A0A0N8PSZ1_9CHLR|nr:hypothetical protein SE17_05960 [Kouleothrix aurantiaca]
MLVAQMPNDPMQPGAMIDVLRNSGKYSLFVVVTRNCWRMLPQGLRYVNRIGARSGCVAPALHHPTGRFSCAEHTSTCWRNIC